MKNLNYIIHLNCAMAAFSKNKELTATDRSLYFALFEVWNQNHFPELLTLNSRKMMDISKIASRTTYLKHLKNLQEFGYLIYYPSYNPGIGSKIKLTRYDTSVVQKLDKSLSKNEQLPVQNMVASNKLNSKHNKPSSKQRLPESLEEVFIFFKYKEWKKSEAEEFYWYNENRGWKSRNGDSIFDWKIYAENWIKKAEQKIAYERKKYQSNLHTAKNKNYGQPL